MEMDARSDRDHPAQAVRRVAKNAWYLGMADAGSKALSFLYYVVAARHLGVEQFGVLSFATAFVAMLGVLTDLGLGTIATREIARNPADAQQQFAGALAIKLVASLAVMAAIIGLLHLIGYPGTTIRVVSICSLTVVASAVGTYYCSVFLGFERMDLVALVRSAQTVMVVIGAVILSSGTAAVERYAFLYVVAVFLALLVAITVGARYMRFRVSFALERWWGLLRVSVPLGLAAVFTMFYYWSGTTILSKLSGPEAVGNYSAAFRLVTGLTFASFAFSTAVFPLFSRLFVSDASRLVRAFELAARYMILLTLPVACFVAVLADPVIRILYGGGYQGAATVLRVLVWWGVFASLNSLVSNYLLSVNRSRIVVLQTGLSLVVSLLLNALLVHSMAAMGAAAAIVVAEAAGLVFLTVWLSQTPVRVLVASTIVTTLRVAAIAAAAVLLAAEAMVVSPLAAAVVGLVAYGVLLVLAGGLDRSDWKVLKPLLRRAQV